ncbi:hypothetical protein BGX27_002288 [Mortierella sp. AM989]|nr:hypothetical protein BGX27_002288 [Mortierella sp. AM989]
MKRRQKYEQHGIMFGPTVQAIKRAWKVLKSEPSGYGPLALGSPVSESFSDGEDDSVYESTLLNMENNNTPFVDLMQQDAPCIKCISDHDKNSSVRPQFSVLPRPRSILLASLGAWTILMALSSIFGFNSVQISGEKTFPAPFYNDMSENSSGIDLQSWEPMSMGNVRQGGIIVIEESGSNGDMDNELDFLNTVTSMLEKGLANSEEADRRIDEEPFATIKSSIVIVNKQSQDETKPALPVPELNQVEQEDVDMDQDDIIDFSEPDSLDALIMDPEDAYLFHNFLEHLEFEDQEAKALEESTLEAQRQKQLEVIKATDDLVITSMLDNDLPCGAQASIADLTPNWVKGLSNLTQFGENHRRGQIFKYLPGWTELMILTVTMCLGSLLVGLGQAKMLHYQLSLQQQQQQPHVSESNKHMSIATILSCLAVSGSALGLTLLMIFSECWDVPSVYFVGIGIAGMILVHAWVPDMALQVEYIDDFVQDGYQLVYDEEAQFGINDEKSFVTDRRNAFEERL